MALHITTDTSPCRTSAQETRAPKTLITDLLPLANLGDVTRCLMLLMVRPSKSLFTLAPKVNRPINRVFTQGPLEHYRHSGAREGSVRDSLNIMGQETYRNKLCLLHNYGLYNMHRSVMQWLRHRATNRKVPGSIPDGVTGFFHRCNPSGRTMVLGSTQPLAEMSTRNISWG
jgi:hypothetical protein